MQGVAIQPLRRDHPTALSLETLEKLILQPATAQRLAFICGQVFKKTLQKS